MNVKIQVSTLSLLPLLASAGCSTFEGMKQDLALAGQKLTHLSGYEQPRAPLHPEKVAPAIADLDILFGSGSARLPANVRDALTKIGDVLQSDPTLKLRVEGYTDAIGAQVANQRLSENRAVVVKHWLVTHGIAKSRIETAGFGAAEPLASNDTVEGRQRNRRVHLNLQPALGETCVVPPYYEHPGPNRQNVTSFTTTTDIHLDGPRKTINGSGTRAKRTSQIKPHVHDSGQLFSTKTTQRWEGIPQLSGSASGQVQQGMKNVVDLSATSIPPASDTAAAAEPHR